MWGRSLPDRRPAFKQSCLGRQARGLKIVGPRQIVAAMQQSGIVKRSVRIAGHATSISLEAAFWQGLCDIAAARGVSLNALVAAIDAGRNGNLSSAIRLFVLDSARSGELAGAEIRSTR
jgi:predicted DNA-binding ribbon-helix-helix protein